MFHKVPVLDNFVELTERTYAIHSFIQKVASCKPTTLKEAPAWIFQSISFEWTPVNDSFKLGSCSEVHWELWCLFLLKTKTNRTAYVFWRNCKWDQQFFKKLLNWLGFFVVDVFLFFWKRFLHFYQPDWEKGLQCNWQELLLNVAVFNSFAVFRGLKEPFCRVTVNSYFFNLFFEPKTRAVFRFVSNIYDGSSCIDWLLWTSRNFHQRYSIKKVFLKIS